MAVYLKSYNETLKENTLLCHYSQCIHCSVLREGWMCRVTTTEGKLCQLDFMTSLSWQSQTYKCQWHQESVACS